jgi:hypothetical protein
MDDSVLQQPQEPYENESTQEHKLSPMSKLYNAVKGSTLYQMLLAASGFVVAVVGIGAALFYSSAQRNLVSPVQNGKQFLKGSKMNPHVGVAALSSSLYYNSPLSLLGSLFTSRWTVVFGIGVTVAVIILISVSLYVFVPGKTTSAADVHGEAEHGEGSTAKNGTNDKPAMSQPEQTPSTWAYIAGGVGLFVVVVALVVVGCCCYFNKDCTKSSIEKSGLSAAYLINCINMKLAIMRLTILTRGQLVRFARGEFEIDDNPNKFLHIIGLIRNRKNFVITSSNGKNSRNQFNSDLINFTGHSPQELKLLWWFLDCNENHLYDSSRIFSSPTFQDPDEANLKKELMNLIEEFKSVVTATCSLDVGTIPKSVIFNFSILNNRSISINCHGHYNEVKYFLKAIGMPIDCEMDDIRLSSC